MRTLLVKPPIPSRMVLNVIPHLGLGYLATALRRAGWPVDVLDCVRDELDVEGLVRHVEKTRPDVVGLSLFSHDVPVARRITAALAELPRGPTTLAGGPHPTGMGPRTLDQIPALDMAFDGDAEVSLPLLLSRLAAGAPAARRDLDEVPGLIWRKEGTPTANGPAPQPPLDTLDFPAWDLMDPRSYPDAPQGVQFRKKPIAPIVTTRGCPFKCTFCQSGILSEARFIRRSPESILAEIELLTRDYGVREISILDDNFTLNHRHAVEVCEGFLRSGLEISWGCPNGVRLDTLTPELLALMKRAGCYYISAGIESGSDETLRRMKKDLTVEQIRERVALVRQAGLDVNGFFILGYPGETEEDILRTIHFAGELGLTHAAFYCYLPLPGTESWVDLEAAGDLDEPDWEEYFQASTPYAPEGLDRRRLKALSRHAYRSFYFKPSAVLRVLSTLRSVSQFRFLFRRALAYL